MHQENPDEVFEASQFPTPDSRNPTNTASVSTPTIDEAPSMPAVVAGAFTKLRLVHRVRVLRRLLMPVGPMALTVLGGGVFAKYAAQARWPRMSVSLEDAARVTSSQVYELVRYVEQSNPHVLQQVMVVLSRDATTMAAVGASVTALVMQHLSARQEGVAVGMTVMWPGLSEAKPGWVCRWPRCPGFRLAQPGLPERRATRPGSGKW